MRETMMSVTCNGLHIEDQVISSSSDEIVAETSAPIVEQNFHKRALRNAPILPCRRVRKDRVVCIHPFVL